MDAAFFSVLSVLVRAPTVTCQAISERNAAFFYSTAHGTKLKTLHCKVVLDLKKDYEAHITGINQPGLPLE
jgi:hypothetical protein